jgi:hypothetical protein
MWPLWRWRQWILTEGKLNVSPEMLYPRQGNITKHSTNAAVFLYPRDQGSCAWWCRHSQNNISLLSQITWEVLLLSEAFWGPGILAQPQEGENSNPDADKVVSSFGENGCSEAG